MKRKLISNIARMDAAGMSQELRQRWLNCRAMERPKAEARELLIYDAVGPDYWDGGGITGQWAMDWLKNLDASASDITVRINSPGGDVQEGVAIYNALVHWQQARDGRKITVRIDAMAASIASVIAMAGDEIVIAGNAMMMIHNASTITWGNAADHDSTATILRQVDETIVNTYVARTEKPEADIRAWMDAETFMTAAEAVERGFADRAEELKGKPKTESAEAENHAAQQRLAQARKRHAQQRQSAIAGRLSMAS